MPSKAHLCVILKNCFTEEEDEALRGYINLQSSHICKEAGRKTDSELTTESCILSRLPKTSLLTSDCKGLNQYP